MVINSGQTADFSGVSTSGILFSSRSTASGATIIGGSGGDKIKAGAAGDDITGGAGTDVLYNFDTANDHIDLSFVAMGMGDISLRQSGSGATLATTVTIAGTQPGDAIALRGVSMADINANAGFFQFGQST